jgi:excisionase family DNA binding protein
MDDAISFESYVRGLVRDTVRNVMREELSARRNALPASSAEDPYLSVTKAARVADVAPGTIRAWIRAGRLTAKHAGRVLRISRAELDRFMRNEAVGPLGQEIQRRAEHLFSSRR